MSTVAEKLHTWSLQELCFISESGLSKIPYPENFRCLTKGKNKRIWTYIINHVRSQSSVEKIKRTLHFKRLLKGEENFLPFDNENDIQLEKLQTAVSNAEQRRIFLKRSLSTIEERILNAEKKVVKINDQICQINQKTALFELLMQYYGKKNKWVKTQLNKILSFKTALNAYRSEKLCDKVLLSCNYLYGGRISFNEINSAIKDLIVGTSNLIKLEFKSNVNNSGISDNFQNTISEFKNLDVMLIDFVIFLRELCEGDMEQFVTTKSKHQSIQDFISYRNKNHPIKQLLTYLKYKNMQHFFATAKNKAKTDKVLCSKERNFKLKIEAMEDKLPEELQIKSSLLEVLAENEGIAVSNKYLEDYLETMSKENNILSKEIQKQKVQSEDLGNVTQNFYQNADLTFYYVYTSKDVLFKILNDLHNMQSFAHFDLFESDSYVVGHSIVKESLVELKKSFELEKKLMLNYCDKVKLIEPLTSEPYVTDFILPSEVCKNFCIQGFRNLSTLCETWFCFKKRLHKDMSQCSVFVNSDGISTSKMYAKFMQLLEKMRHSIETGSLSVNDGMLCHNKTKVSIQDWWEQSAQFIPIIEHEDKTLKMWIDILSVLSDFEPPNYF